MSPIEYRRHEEPGCGGCLLVFLALVLLSGGAPLLFQVLGLLLYAGLFLFLALVALFWATTFFIRKKVSAYERSQTEAHNHFVFLLVHILVKIARIDGTITRREIATIRRFFQLHLNYCQSQLMWVRDLIKEATHSTAELEGLLADFRSRFAYEPRLLLLDLIYQVLFSNDEVKRSELELVRQIARYLGISPFDQRVAEAKFTGARRPEAGRESPSEKERKSLELLGLEKGADFEEIKASYRRLSMKHHPDKVRHLGEEFRKVAEEKMKDLNEAYEFLEKRNGTAH
jgi:DnaJ like chaperone protein